MFFQTIDNSDMIYLAESKIVDKIVQSTIRKHRNMKTENMGWEIYTLYEESDPPWAEEVYTLGGTPIFRMEQCKNLGQMCVKRLTQDKTLYLTRGHYGISSLLLGYELELETKETKLENIEQFARTVLNEYDVEESVARAKSSALGLDTGLDPKPKTWSAVLEAYSAAHMEKIDTRLPNWITDEDERDYNQRAKEITGYELHDRLQAKTENVELCDLFNPVECDFIHVKKEGKSSDIRVLASQGFHSALYIEKSRWRDIPLESTTYTFAIIRKKFKKEYTDTLVSRLALGSSVFDMQRMGVKNVRIVSIPCANEGSRK